MVYDCGCAMVSRPSCFMNSVEMRFFWLPLSTRNCSGEPFTHIYDWKRRSPSSRSSGSSLWSLLVEIMALGSTSIICFPMSSPLSGSSSGSEHASDYGAFSSAASNCFVWHSFSLWVGLLWNSHHFTMSFFGFLVVFWVTPLWRCPLFCGS